MYGPTGPEPASRAKIYSNQRLERDLVSPAVYAPREANRWSGRAGWGFHHSRSRANPSNLRQVLNVLGRPEWTRTIDLFRVKEAL